LVSINGSQVLFDYRPRQLGARQITPGSADITFTDHAVQSADHYSNYQDSIRYTSQKSYQYYLKPQDGKT
jgi:hypothetical protein